VAYSGLTGTAPTWNQSTTGNAATATALTGGLASLGIGFVSVKKCGSTGDGSTDDTAAILSCIEYANTNKLNLYVPAGIYKFTSSLNMCAVVGNPTASCTFPWGLEVWGEGRFVSILAPNLSSPGPALDFGGATNAGIHHIGIVDPSGDQATVGVLSTHGGMSGAVGDVFTSDDVNIGMSGSTAFGMIVLGADLSGIANTQISAGCSALVIGDGLGTASAVTSPFYTIGNSNNGFSLANIGTANSANTFTSYNCPAMQLTGSGSYNFSGINYAVVDGTPAGANLTGVITVTGGEGNNLYGGTIRTENNAHTGVTPIPLPAFYLGTGVAIHSINLNLDLGLNAGDYAFAGSSSASINNGTINCGACVATAGFFNLPSTSAYTVSRVTAYIGTGSGGLGTVGRFNGNTVYWFGGAKSSILAQLPSGASSDLICANDGCINTDLTISGNVNGLALVAAASGFTMAGGTISKTLTVGANINTGSTDGTLGSAAFTASTAYDASGAAATAQSNAETYASNASNLSTGTLSHALLPALQSADIPNNTANTSGTAATATSATNFSGSLAGDVTGTQGSTSVVKVNGAAVPVSKTVVGTNASGQIVDASSAVLPTVVTNPGDLLCAQAGDTTIGAASITAGSSTPSAMTYTINFSSIVPGWFYVGQIVSSQGNTPSGYNGAPLTVTAVSPSSATVTVSSTNNPATLTSGGTLSLYCSNQATDAAQTGWYNLGGQTAFSTIYTIPGNTIKAGYTLNLKPQLLTFSPSSGQSNGKMAYSLYYGASPLWFIDSNASGGSGIQLSQSYVPGGQGATTNFDFSLVGLSTTLFVTSQSSAAYPSNASNLGGVLAGYSTVNGYAISPNFLVTTSNQNVALKVAWWPGSLKSGTYTSGITATGSTGQTCSLSSFNNVTGATATVALTGTNTIASGTALVVTAGGTNASGASTTATAANGTATCSGTATVSTTMGGTPGYAALLIDWVGRN
jgi:hypothetical protein